MKTYGGGGGTLPLIINLGTSGEWSASRPERVTPGERATDTHSTGGWVGPRAGLERWRREKKPCPRPVLNSGPARRMKCHSSQGITKELDTQLTRGKSQVKYFK